MEEKELIYLLASVVILALLVIVWLLAMIYELRANSKEWENRTLNLESDLTQARIRIALQDEEIGKLEEMKRLQLKNAIDLENSNSLLREELEALRLEFFELESNYRI